MLLPPGVAWSYTWLCNPVTKHYYAGTVAKEIWEQAEAEALLPGGATRATPGPGLHPG